MFEQLINRSAQISEQDFRLQILNALLSTPHRQVAPYMPLFKYVSDRDPLFFARLAAWYFDYGSVRDLKQLFVACMSTSRFSDEHRSAGLAMLQKLPPFEVERVIGLVKGHTENGKFVEGVSGSVPRSVKTTVEHYLRDREGNREVFDNVVLHARKPLKTLYASLRIKPGEYAQRVLFDNDPPADSRLFVLKQLAKTEDPAEQARLIVEYKVPYRVAVSALKQVTPSVLAALVAAMSPQELLNNLASLKKRGAMDNSDLRELVEAKLQQAKTDTRVSALKTREAIKSANLDEDMARKVESVGDAQIRSKASIKRATALHIDKSGSMDQAIEVGKQIASMIAPVCEAGLFVYAFDTMAYPISAKGGELSDWEKAFKGITAGGGTSCGVALETMRRQKQAVEQIIMVTDQEENTQPYLVQALNLYQADFAMIPNVIIVTIGGRSKHLEQALGNAGMPVDSFNFNGDYYSLPSLLPMLAGGTRLELLMDIMSYPLPERKVKSVPAAQRA